MKRYNTLDSYLKKRFSGKIGKVCVDGGFSCPNRENGNRGCLFCTDAGAGEFAGDRKISIARQIEDQKKILKRKWKLKGFIAYFQNFTNTYGAIEELRDMYEQALNCNEIVGIAIATRPDCLSEPVMELLRDINKKAFLWIELGLQTCHQKTALLINRGYDSTVFEKAVMDLTDSDILTVVHLIAGLPGETKEDFLESVTYLNQFRIFGIKIHSLYIQTDSPICDFLEKQPFELLSEIEYVEYVCDAIERMRPDIVIHRLTGDGKKELLYGPKWILDKLKVLSDIDGELEKRSSHQGIAYHI